MRTTLLIGTLFALALPLRAEDQPKLPPGAIAYLGAGNERENLALRVEFTPDGKGIWIFRPKVVTLIDAATFKTIWEFKPPAHLSAEEHCQSPDGKTFVTFRSDWLIQVWDFATRKEIGRIPHSGEPSRLVFAVFVSNETVLIGMTSLANIPREKDTVDGSLFLWDLNKQREVARTGWRTMYQLPKLRLPDGRSEVCVNRYGTCLYAVRTFRPDEADRFQRWLAYGTTTHGWSGDGRLVAQTIPVSVDADEKLINNPRRKSVPKPWVLSVIDIATGEERAKIPQFGWGSSSTFKTVVFLPDNRSCVTLDNLERIQVWELASGSVRFRLPLSKSGPTYMSTGAISPDGRLLATIADDGVFVWPMRPTGKETNLPLTGERFDVLWADLVGMDAAKSYQAMLNLATASNSVAFIAEVAHKPTALSSRVSDALRTLDAPQFAEREKAMAELIEVGEDARATLTRELSRKELAPESSRRIKSILARLPPRVVGLATLDEVQASRVIELLEQIGTKEAVALIKKYEADYRHQPLGREAKETVERLQRSSDRR
jgi:WD40 repeat protein